MTISDEMVERAVDAAVNDLLHGKDHGARIRGANPDNFNIDGHVDLRSLARAALTAALQGQVVVPADPTAWMAEWDEGGEHVRQFYTDEETARRVKWNVASYKVGVTDPVKVTPLYAPSLTRPDGKEGA
jgi:hypothetical protein